VRVRAAGGPGRWRHERGANQHVPRHEGVAQGGHRPRPTAEPREGLRRRHHDGH